MAKYLFRLLEVIKSAMTLIYQPLVSKNIVVQDKSSDTSFPVTQESDARSLHDAVQTSSHSTTAVASDKPDEGRDSPSGRVQVLSRPDPSIHNQTYELPILSDVKVALK